MAEVGFYLNIGTLAALAMAISGAVWKLTRVEAAVRSDMDGRFSNLKEQLIAQERDSSARAESIRHETGEMGAAIRQKVTDVEIHARDTFVRKDSFEMVVKRIESSIEKLGDRLEQKVERIFERKGRAD